MDNRDVVDGSKVLRVAFAEFLGTTLFVFFSGALLVITQRIDGGVSTIRMLTLALFEGFLFYSLVYATMKLTDGDGGYMNPAITLAVKTVDYWKDQVSGSIGAASKKTQWWYEVVAIFLTQLAGAFAGAGLIYGLIPRANSGPEPLGTHFRNPREAVWAAFIMEMVVSWILIYVVLAVRLSESRRSSIILALAYIPLKLIAFPFTGASFNFFRALGPAAVSGNMANWWIYLTGSLAGAILATAYVVGLRIYVDFAPASRPKSQASN